jgi:hypothetical protein
MDTRHVLDELLAQYDDATETPAGLDAEEAELIRRVMHLAPEAVDAGAADGKPVAAMATPFAERR